MMRLAVLGLLALSAFAESDTVRARWRFTFTNGDQVHADLRGIRGGTLILRMRAAPNRSVSVHLRDVAKAQRRQDQSGEKAPQTLMPQILRLRDGSALLGRFDGIDQGRLRFAVDSIGPIELDGAEIDELLPAADVVRAYYRSVAPPSAPQGRLRDDRLDAFWIRLGRRDPNQAWDARRALVRAGAGALPGLAVRLKRQPDSPGEIRLLIATLDGDAATARLRAQMRLRELGPVAEPLLRQALREKLSPEVHKRVRVLLEGLPLEGETPPAPPVLRVLRAVRVLEEIGTPEAAALLERLANGAPGVSTTVEARAALDRLRIRGQ